MNNQHSEGVGTLIFSRSTSRYLFLLRSKGKTLDNWGIVGGKVESNETVIQALIREIQEEIGVDFSNKKFITLETFTADDGKFVYYTFVVTVDEEFIPVLNKEHTGYCWTVLDHHPKPLHPGLWRSFKFDIIKRKIKTLEAILK